MNLRFCFLPMAIATFACAEADAETAPAGPVSGTLFVALSSDPSPYGQAARGKPTGFDAALFADFRSSGRARFQMRLMPADAIDAGLADGSIGLAAESAAATPERARAADFGPPLAEATLYYVTRAADRGIARLADLGGRKFGVAAGSANFVQLSEFEHFLAKAGGRLGPSVDFPSDADALAALKAGRVDFAIAPLPVLDAALRAEPEAFRIGQPVSEPRFVAWRVVKGNTTTLGLVADFVARERKSGRLAALQRRYLGRVYAHLPSTADARDWWHARQDKPSHYTIPTVKDPD